MLLPIAIALLLSGMPHRGNSGFAEGPAVLCVAHWLLTNAMLKTHHLVVDKAAAVMCCVAGMRISSAKQNKSACASRRLTRKLLRRLLQVGHAFATFVLVKTCKCAYCFGHMQALLIALILTLLALHQSLEASPHC